MFENSNKLIHTITKKKTILLVFGTRPEAIKMAPLILELEKHPFDFRTLICVTGQHRELLDQVLELFSIKPDYDLSVMQKGQDLYELTSRILLSMRSVLENARPDLVLVHGDTTTSFTAALACFYKHIPVGHVEAGLRTNDIYNPFPEELCRQMTARISYMHFTPTLSGKDNLIRENVPAENIIVTGNTVIDALNNVVAKIRKDIQIKRKIQESIQSFGYNIERLDGDRRLILITGHRRENFGSSFLNICKAIKSLVQKYPNVDFVYPMHLNPNVRAPIIEVFGKRVPGNLFLIEPLEYLNFIHLMDLSYFILTDSGGIQEEAPSLGKPVLVMRNTTERPEAVDAGVVKLVGSDYKSIFDGVSELLDDFELYTRMSQSLNPYGDGLASQRIVNTLINL